MSTADSVQLLLAIHEHHERQSRHHDDQNAKVVSLVLVLASAALGLVGLDNRIDAIDIWLGAFLFLIGCYGAAFSTKHYERHFRKKLAAHKVRDEIETICTDPQLRDLRLDAESDHLQHFPQWLIRRPLYHAWIAVHVFVAGFGVAVTLLAIRA